MFTRNNFLSLIILILLAVVVAACNRGTTEDTAVSLRTEHFVPYERERQLLADLFELPISAGSIQNFAETAAANVQPVTEAIKAAVTAAEVAHMDETGFYVNGQRAWLHTVSTPELTYYQPHAKRGQKVTEAMGILPHFTGTLVHDAWATYFK